MDLLLNVLNTSEDPSCYEEMWALAPLLQLCPLYSSRAVLDSPPPTCNSGIKNKSAQVPCKIWYEALTFKGKARFLHRWTSLTKQIKSNSSIVGLHNLYRFDSLCPWTLDPGQEKPKQKKKLYLEWCCSLWIFEGIHVSLVIENECMSRISNTRDNKVGSNMHDKMEQINRHGYLQHRIP